MIEVSVPWKSVKFEVHHMGKDDELDDWMTYSPYLESCSPTTMPKEVSAEEMERHQLTHLPKVDWCESRTATKSQENKGEDFRTIIDRRSKAWWEGATCSFLVCRGPPDQIGHSYPCTKQGQVWTEVCCPAAGERYSWNGWCEAVDQDRSRTRAALKLRSEIQLVAVGQHQGLLVERCIQTVRRQKLCLLHELEAKTGVSITPGSVLSTWAIRHSGWLLNRFQPASGQGGQTPYEIRFERRYAGKLVPFGSTIFAGTYTGSSERCCPVSEINLFGQERFQPCGNHLRYEGG